MMERLTDKVFDCMASFCDARDCVNYKIDGCCSFERYRHLAYYEDLEEQGRLVVLPCKVGDSYYTIDRECTDEDGEVQHPTGSDCEWCCKECDGKPIIGERCFANVIQILMYERYLGKTVFLTREEAEQALGGAEG